ncbi:TRAP-type C4-dicarboxylate transport system, small permease component [Palleronia marisminoris]|uniref:TRAP transporter small permease protein n=1 Tax=Palleronia marisminoris TaxID=315423 RepID=A0A1Y5SA33_9RHOB|nr:TRAP transporter small permease [Palleronia marisminoris]SFG67622.1 TRAP-type C4-dicarboxylate transport system, small permease component [Palleronia marisminoris]SLN34399.1 Tripartite ATP-independent periplasmic transporters, DctQ component [Palleronia marisminoris]
MTSRLTAMSRATERATLALSVLGGVCLIGVVAVVTAGVVMRYAFDAPMLGVNEIVELSAVALVMSALPYCTQRNGHVAVDVFDTMLGRYGRFIGDLLSRGIAIAILTILCRRAILKALDAAEWGDATNMLQWPLWPYYAVLAAGVALTAVVFAVQVVLLVARGPR